MEVPRGPGARRRRGTGGSGGSGPRDGGQARPLQEPASALGSTALRALAGAPVALLLVEHRRVGAYRLRRVLVVYDGSEGAGRALDAAARLAEASRISLTVLLVAEDSEAMQDMELVAAHAIERRSIEVRWQALPWAEGFNLLRVIQSDEAALLVLSLSSPQLPEATVGKLLEHVTNPVLLIR